METNEVNEVNKVREAILKLKEHIKNMAVRQKQDKLDRKTSRYKPEEHAICWKAALRVQERKSEITAALNLYLELRGRDYRHGSYDYAWHTHQLRSKFEIEAPVA